MPDELSPRRMSSEPDRLSTEEDLFRELFEALARMSTSRRHNPRHTLADRSPCPCLICKERRLNGLR